MRILVVQESDWIARGPHQSHHLMERLSKRGHEIRVIDYEILWRQQNKNILSVRRVFEEVHKATNDGSVIVIRPAIIKVPILNYFSLIYAHKIEIKRQIEEFKPDVIIGFGILNANIGIRLAKKSGIPFIYYIIDELHRLVPESAFQRSARFVEKQNMKNADKIISINEGLREYTILMGAPKERTKVIGAGVDFERFNGPDGKYIRSKYGIKDNDLVLFFMGWLYDFSGLKEVAVNLTKYKNKNIKLLIIGKGDLWDVLQNIKMECGLNGNLIMIEWVPYDDVPKHLAASDVCILPAYKNDIMKNIVPIKVYEYMAMAKPVITTELPGVMKEFGENQGVIYVKKPKDVIQKAIDLIDFGNVKTEGEKARKFVEKYSWDRITVEFESVLKDVIKNA